MPGFFTNIQIILVILYSTSLYYFQYLMDVPEWSDTLDQLQVPEEIPELEDAISKHQTFIETISQSYTEVGKDIYQILVLFIFPQ